MNVPIKNNLESYIQEKVAAGDYNSSAEVLQEALRLLKQQDNKKDNLMNALQDGLDDINAGRISTQTIDEIFNEAMNNRKEAH